MQVARQQVAEIAQLELDEVELDVPLTTLGLDSIMAIELQTWLENALGNEVSMDLFLKDLSLRELVSEVLSSGTELDENAAVESLDEEWVEGAL